MFLIISQLTRTTKEIYRHSITIISGTRLFQATLAHLNRCSCSRNSVRYLLSHFDYLKKHVPL